MSAVYRPRSRWRRWTAFTVAVLGLTAMVMLLGVWLVMTLTSGPEPKPTPAPTPREEAVGG